MKKLMILTARKTEKIISHSLKILKIHRHNEKKNRKTIY
jgi:hypothetical protein